MMLEETIRQIVREEIKLYFDGKKTDDQSEFIPLKQFFTTYAISPPSLYRYVKAKKINLYKVMGKSFLKTEEVKDLFQLKK